MPTIQDLAATHDVATGPPRLEIRDITAVAPQSADGKQLMYVAMQWGDQQFRTSAQCRVFDPLAPRDAPLQFSGDMGTLPGPARLGDKEELHIAIRRCHLFGDHDTVSVAVPIEALPLAFNEPRAVTVAGVTFELRPLGFGFPSERFAIPTVHEVREFRTMKNDAVEAPPKRRTEKRKKHNRPKAPVHREAGDGERIPGRVPIAAPDTPAEEPPTPRHQQFVLLSNSHATGTVPLPAVAALSPKPSALPTFREHFADPGVTLQELGFPAAGVATLGTDAEQFCQFVLSHGATASTPAPSKDLLLHVWGAQRVMEHRHVLARYVLRHQLASKAQIDVVCAALPNEVVDPAALQAACDAVSRSNSNFESADWDAAPRMQSGDPPLIPPGTELLSGEQPLEAHPCKSTTPTDSSGPSEEKAKGQWKDFHTDDGQRSAGDLLTSLPEMAAEGCDPIRIYKNADQLGPLLWSGTLPDGMPALPQEYRRCQRLEELLTQHSTAPPIRGTQTVGQLLFSVVRTVSGAASDLATALDVEEMRTKFPEVRSPLVAKHTPHVLNGHTVPIPVVLYLTTQELCFAGPLLQVVIPYGAIGYLRRVTSFTKGAIQVFVEAGTVYQFQDFDGLVARLATAVGVRNTNKVVEVFFQLLDLWQVTNNDNLESCQPAPM